MPLTRLTGSEIFENPLSMSIFLLNISLPEISEIRTIVCSETVRFTCSVIDEGSEFTHIAFSDLSRTIPVDTSLFTVFP